MNNEFWKVYISNEETMFEMINQVLNIVTIAISLIAAILLFVGGIGVMNIMLVSIIERTNEIGVRKALGAQNSSIRIQFVIESIIICIIGGVIGIIIGLFSGVLFKVAGSIFINNMYAEYAQFIEIIIQLVLLAGKGNADCIFSKCNGRISD